MINRAFISRKLSSEECKDLKNELYSEFSYISISSDEERKEIKGNYVATGKFILTIQLDGYYDFGGLKYLIEEIDKYLKEIGVTHGQI